MVIVYTYKNCSTCRKAIKLLRERRMPFEEKPIRENPPTPDELRQMLEAYGGEIRRLFNTSGLEYRAQKMKDVLPSMSTEEAIALLAGNGNLVKRPFLLTGTGGAAGFDEAEWRRLI